MYQPLSPAGQAPGPVYNSPSFSAPQQCHGPEKQLQVPDPLTTLLVPAPQGQYVPPAVQNTPQNLAGPGVQYVAAVSQQSSLSLLDIFYLLLLQCACIYSHH